jgi:DNA-binding MarR family transcriptional regulator
MLAHSSYKVGINIRARSLMDHPSETFPTPQAAAAIERACHCFAAQKAARTLGRLYDAFLRPVGLSNWQFTMLMMLVRDEAPTISELARDLAMDRTSVTANLKPLERGGLIAIRIDDKDRRVRRAYLTEQGRVALAQAIPLWTEAQAACSDRTGGNGGTSPCAEGVKASSGRV